MPSMNNIVDPNSRLGSERVASGLSVRSSGELASMAIASGALLSGPDDPIDLVSQPAAVGANGHTIIS
jgi:hypothetical protein